ncbi:hypothetical protein PV327_004221 [Microctonus hyperodae]|uniref:Uncharacterized protein n=1 Tax=Microctonus hyperodae TaxID=165561 RepID=A0AA39FBX9_MICHY|nr:hypothetical protein PV327_004221 [Microctonus hyperodae]
MNINDIPEECINDPRFVQILTVTLSSEYATNEKILKGLAEGVKALKATVAKEIEGRKIIKRQIKENKDRKIIMEPVLDQLLRDGCERRTKLILLKNRLDEVSLRRQIDQNKYKKILNEYKKTWDEYQAEYEEFELAIMRKQCKIEWEKLKIQLMIKEQNKIEYLNILKQREIINQKRIQSVIVKLSKMILDRWEKQKCLNVLNDNIKRGQEEFQTVVEKCNELQKQLEIEAETEAMARQQMPVPKLNISLVQSLYIDKNSSSQCSREQKYQRKRLIESDTISVNTVMFEEMCNNENIELDEIYETCEHNEEENNKLLSSSSNLNSDNLNNTTNLQPESNIVTLGNICSQLSINEDEPCNNENHQTDVIDKEIVSESFQLLSQKQLSDIIINNPSLKHKSATSECSSNPKNDEEQQQKKMKVMEPTLHSSLPSSFITHQNNPRDETQFSLGNNRQSLITTVDSLPQIKKIETITRPITIQTKPPTAEVPPTPSSLFSPRHYAPSYASSGNFDHYCDVNYNDPGQDACSLDNYSENWQNLSPPHAESEISYNSTNAEVKNVESINNPPNFISQPQKPATSNFLSFFNCGAKNPKSLF